MALRFLVIAAAIILLAAIAICSLTSSPNMREMWWIPDWLGTWADRNGNFRNFPVFAAFAALLFFVLSLSPLKHWSSELPNHFPLRLAFGAFLATALLGTSLEVAQLLFLANRHFDWADIGWSTSGALVGATVAAACFRIATTGN